MNKKRNIICLILCIILFATFGQTLKVHAATNDNYKIISNCDVTVKQAKKWAKSKGATETFIDLADLYWKYYKSHGNINPGIAYVQAAKETGYGNFGGVLDESFHNPCGLKTSEGGDDYDASAHKMFNSWDEGVQAHLDHLALYAGADDYPRSNNTYDPRHYITLKGRSTTTNELGGSNKWCPSITYGDEVSNLYSSLLISSGLKEEVNKNQDNKKVLPNAQSVKTSANNNISITSSIGWRIYNGKWYYYKSDKTLATGWINPDSNWYYLESNGEMVVGWKKLGGTWYYLNENGTMKTGWIKLSGKWYYLQADGSMVTGLRNIGGKIYYLGNDGDMLIGKQNINGDIYYFDENSGSLDLDKSEINTKEDVKEDTEKDTSERSGKVIVVDPGHARGTDSGVKTGDYDETELDMELSLKLKNKLQTLGYKVILTRTEDQGFSSISESLYHRVDVANDNNADLFISIHHNSAIPTAQGVETYYTVGVRDEKYGGGKDESRIEKSKELAKEICDNICEKIDANNRGAKPDNLSAHDSLCVLKNTNMPAVLIETGFLTNPEEAERCTDSASQELVAEAIAEVISKNIK